MLSDLHRVQNAIMLSAENYSENGLNAAVGRISQDGLTTHNSEHIEGHATSPPAKKVPIL
jgi:hypothetical protein